MGANNTRHYVYRPRQGSSGAQCRLIKKNVLCFKCGHHKFVQSNRPDAGKFCKHCWPNNRQRKILGEKE